MSFKFINGIQPKPIKEDLVIKDNTPNIDPNNPTRNMDIALETLKDNILLKYKKWGDVKFFFSV